MYPTLEGYGQNSVCPISHDIASRKRKQERQRRVCRGMGIDCLLYLDEWDTHDMDRQRNCVHKNEYDRQYPYAYQFSSDYAEYPYDVHYTDEFSDGGNRYLPIFPSSDSTTRVQYRDLPLIDLPLPMDAKDD